MYLFVLFILCALAFLWYFFFQKLPSLRFKRYFDLRASLLWPEEQQADQLVRGSLLLELTQSFADGKGFLIESVRFSRKELHLRNFDKLYLDAANEGQQLSVAIYMARKYLSAIRDKELTVELTGYIVHKENKKSAAVARYSLRLDEQALPVAEDFV